LGMWAFVATFFPLYVPVISSCTLPFSPICSWLALFARRSRGDE
jgi:hypothetical protein